MLGSRQRISDLRKFFLLDIQADSHRDPYTHRLHTLYFVPEAARCRAEWLWRHGSLVGYSEGSRQEGIWT
jgi:hypothetical protein